MRVALHAALVLLLPAVTGARPVAQDAPAVPAAQPQLRAVEFSGTEAFDREQLLRMVGVRVGHAMPREAGDLASRLALHYRIRGYPAARASGRFDAETGSLSFVVDEGRLSELHIEGVSPAEGARVSEVLALERGAVLRDADVTLGLRRLEDRSQGAFETVGEPPYEVTHTSEGAELTLRLRRRAVRLEVSPRGGTGRESLHNRVDGYTPGVRVRLLLSGATAIEPYEAYARASFGFASERLRFAAGARRSFFAERALSLGYEFHDFTDTDDSFRGIGLERPAGRPIFLTSYEDYYRRRGHEAYAWLRLSPRLHLGVNARGDRYDSLPLETNTSLFLLDDGVPPNPPVQAGLMRSLLVTGRFALDTDLFRNRADEAESFLVHSPHATGFDRDQTLRVELSYERADADAFGGDFRFERFLAHVRAARHLAPAHVVSGRVLLGLGSDGLPAQRSFRLGGQGTLRGRPRDELSGDHMALASLEYAFEPGSPWPGPVLFYDGGSAWSDGISSAGWRNDVGLGLAWPGGGTRIVRVDVAIPLDPLEGGRRARVTGSVVIPLPW